MHPIWKAVKQTEQANVVQKHTRTHSILKAWLLINSFVTKTCNVFLATWNMYDSFKLVHNFFSFHFYKFGLLFYAIHSSVKWLSTRFSLYRECSCTVWNGQHFIFMKCLVRVMLPFSKHFNCTQNINCESAKSQKSVAKKQAKSSSRKAHISAATIHS